MAQIYFGLPGLTVPLNSTFEVGVFLDGQGQAIAALDTDIVLPNGLELVDIRDGNSIVSLWVERPLQTANSISFSGAIPGGFAGDRGELVILVVKATQPGDLKITTENTQILLNDGLGTEADILPGPIIVTAVSGAEVTPYVAPEDGDRPESFVPLIAQHGDLGGWVAIFSTQDKGSGLDHYEVREGRFGWSLASSPYLLSDQRLHHDIYIRAIDRAGNERIEKVEAPAGHLWYLSPIFWGILLIAIVATALMVRMRTLWGSRGTFRS